MSRPRLRPWRTRAPVGTEGVSQPKRLISHGIQDTGPLETGASTFGIARQSDPNMSPDRKYVAEPR
jgi:hypothetical protein